MNNLLLQHSTQLSSQTSSDGSGTISADVLMKDIFFTLEDFGFEDLLTAD